MIPKIKLINTKLKSIQFSAVKFISIAQNLTNQQILLHRAALFEQEKERQLKEIERIEKIGVILKESNEETKLIMNKKLSTPLNVAMHLSELLEKRSVLALINDKTLWDMNRPLEDNCEMKFLHFKDKDPSAVNKAFWRSCSFILGYLLETAFKDSVKVDLCSFPPPNINSGSFIYDAGISLPDWKPTNDELRCLSISAVKLINKHLSFERLRIKRQLAEEMFKYNKFKLEQIPFIAKKQKEENESYEYVTVYKLGDFVDMSQGPMISNTSLIGRFQVTGIFGMNTDSYGKLHRVQGVAIPTQLQLHNWTFSMLADRASKLNESIKPELNTGQNNHQPDPELKKLEQQ